MDATTASLIGAAIGAISGLGGGYLGGLWQSRLERAKWLRSRNDEREKQLRIAVAELTRKLAVGTHQIAWLTWKARNAPAELTEEDISIYNGEMKALLPDIVASRVVVDALDKSIHAKVTPLVEILYALDAQVALAGILFKSSKEDCAEALASYYETCLDIDKRILQEVTEMMRLDETNIQA